jgi:hypothetical protein
MATLPSALRLLIWGVFNGCVLVSSAERTDHHRRRQARDMFVERQQRQQ